MSGQGRGTPAVRAVVPGIAAAVVAAVAAAMTLGACTAGGTAPGTPRAWLTTADQSRLLAADSVRPAGPATDTGQTVVTVDETRTFQEMVGWGAAMTDASAYVIRTHLDSARRDALVRELFGRGDGGIGLGMLRVPIGASDFSRMHYTHLDLPPGATDTAMARFSIAMDRAAKLPALRAALAANPELEIVGSPWSPPAWMKTSGSLIRGTLKPEYAGAFALYLAKWVEAYAAEGMPVRAITLQNEPHHEPADYPGMRLAPAQRAALIARHVGPLFARRGIRAEIWEWDHNWDEPASPLAVLADSGARRYVSGVAWHCYNGDVAAQSPVRDAHPEKDAWFTECSGGEWAPSWPDNLKWNVANLVIGTARHWARGVMLWNLALDERHGPHLGGCGDCRGVVTIDSATGAITRNVEYYALAHASRFVRRGARRVQSDASSGSLANVAFRNPDGSLVLIALNMRDAASTFVVRSSRRAFSYTLPAGAVATFLF